MTLWRGLLAAVVLMMPVGLSGCGAFFVCAKASCTSTGSSNSAITGAYAYATNSANGSTSINGYSLQSGTLVAGTSSPYTLTYVPAAMAVSTNNKYLFVGSNSAVGGGASAIYGYTINAGGALTTLNSGSPLATSPVAAMDVSPDGQWLVVVNAGDGQTIATTVTVFSITASGGLSSVVTQAAVSATALPNTPVSVKVAPSGQYVAVALGTGGVEVFPFTTSNGALGTGQPVSLKSNGSFIGVFDIAIDAGNILYMAAVGGVSSLGVSSSGVPNANLIYTGSTSSTAPFAVALDGTSYVYGAATSSGTSTPIVNTIYQFGNNAGTLTALSPASLTGPTTTTKLAMDSTNKYLLALGYSNTSGLQMYAVGSGGTLTLVSSAATGTTTSVPAYLAMTH